MRPHKMASRAMAADDESGGAMEEKAKKDYGVKIEAKFTVGEYNIVILSAKESTGLDRYLRDQKYQIPKGAAPLLRPYVEAGSKFFVAKVDPKKVKFEKGQAQLSPLRFHYDSEEFSLPIRLGLVSSSGKQDLIVSILAPGQRYEVASYKNATIPTNLDVKDEVRTRFGEFYAALFDRTVEQNPGAVITEYSWDAASCDPCPGPQLDGNDFATLGADVLGQGEGGYYGFVLTRLHARYGKDGAPNDLVFRAAPSIIGGREVRDADGRLEERARPATGQNNFQGRYAIRHPWTGPIACDKPIRGRWGGPPDGSQIAKTQPATNTAFAPRGKVQLPDLVAQDVPEVGVKAGVPLPSGGGFQRKPQGCGCTTGDAGGFAGGAALAGLAMLVMRRRRR
jgi:MYXO-CTERM domain-containing protein